MIYGGYNQEDSLIVNQAAVDRGLFTTHHFTFEKTELEKNEEFTNPDPSITSDIKAYSNYDKLVNGVVPPGTYIESGDIIIGKISKLNKNDQYDNFKYYDKSIVYKYDEPAYVWDVIKGRNEEDNLFCKVIFKSARKVEMGDKFSSRSGQKGTVGISYLDSDMPYTKDGIKPDIIFNPHSLPSRMTMGVLFEGMAAKANAINGTISDGTIFKKIDIDDLADDLAKLGYNRNGTERLYNGMTGNYIDCEIFIGPIYYQRLQKFTVDTVYSHKTCPTDAITHQPLDGKAAKGGLRIGEMEKDCMAISSIKFLQEKFIDHSDVYYIYVCKNCNKRAVVNEKHKIYKCKFCVDNSNIVKIKTTWSCHQLFDEIESCNVGIRYHPNENTYQKFE
jgi:DNA-directed RNA polymerase II subunit RPB2